jgi:hypothetical protein
MSGLRVNNKAEVRSRTSMNFSLRFQVVVTVHFIMKMHDVMRSVQVGVRLFTLNYALEVYSPDIGTKLLLASICRLQSL